MGVITCPHCGLEISDQLLRCPKCDRKTPKALQLDRTWSKVQKERGLQRWVIRLLILALVAGIAWYAWTCASGVVPPGPARTESLPEP
jgi:hypothetical protein